MLKVLVALCFIFIFCSHEGDLRLQETNTRIRVINRTDKMFTRVSMFSIPFGDLKPGDTSKYKILEFVPLKDDPMIYCEMDGDNLARYLKIPDKNSVLLSYSIDSVVDKIMYISYKEEK